MSHDHPHPHPKEPGHSAPADHPATPTQPGPDDTSHRAIEDSGAQALADALRSSFGIVKFLMLLLVALFVISGVFTVPPNQVAVLLRFGRPVGATQEEQLLQPGLHWKLPYPIDEIVPIPVGEAHVLTSTAGWYYLTPEEELAGGRPPENAYNFLTPGLDGYTLTGDGNIVHVRTTVNYRITNPLRYQFGFANITNLMQAVLDNALFYAAARFTADDALYRRRPEFRETVVRRFQESAERYQFGVDIDPREVRIDPPLYVQRAFSEVLEAQQRRDIKIREAETYARGATNKAIGEASVLLQNGLTLSNTLVQSVATDVTNFLGLLPAWQRDAHLLRERLLAQTAQRVFTNAQFKAFLPSRGDGQPWELRLELAKEIEPPKKIESSTAP